MNKTLRFFLIILLVILLVGGAIGTYYILTTDFDPRFEANTGTPKTYVQWWPKVVTPEFYQNKSRNIGGVSFLDYQRATDYPVLKSKFDDLLRNHKPDSVVVLMEWQDVQQLRFTAPNIPVLPGPNANSLDAVVESTFRYAYFDDLIALLRANNIEVILYPVVSPYGGQSAYPFTYYSNVGWFWQRPDWPHGLANPTTDAMRHPPQELNGSDYNWCTHEAGYLRPDCTQRHFALTTDGVQDTLVASGRVPVFESPDMVFNGYDTRLLDGRPIHTPIPSLSSIPHREVTRAFFRNIGSHFRDKGISSYFLYQEPTYALLRENINYCPQNNSIVGDTCDFEVDYSEAERIAYNAWGREFKGFGQNENRPIPFPVDDTYREFREFNLAGFLANLKEGLRETDPEADILLSLTRGGNIQGTGVNESILLSVIRPEAIVIEPPNEATKAFVSENGLSSIINQVRTTSSTPIRKILSYDVQNPVSNDSNRASQLANSGNISFLVPAIRNTCTDPSGFPHWLPPSERARCTSLGQFSFRYQNPVTGDIPGIPTRTPQEPTATPIATATVSPTVTIQPTTSPSPSTDNTPTTSPSVTVTSTPTGPSQPSPTVSTVQQPTGTASPTSTSQPTSTLNPTSTSTPLTTPTSTGQLGVDFSQNANILGVSTRIAGSAPPNSEVRIYLDNQTEFTSINANSQGRWEYTFPNQLTEGSHFVYLSSDGSRLIGPFNFNVVYQLPNSNLNLMNYLVLGISFIVVIVSTLFLVLRRKRFEDNFK